MLSCEYCEIFKNSFFYRTTLVAASGIETYFLFVIRHKHNLMISSSVGSSQYSWRTSYECLPGWGNLSGKIISIKRNHQSGVYFQIAISLIGCVATFSGQLYFWRSYFFTLFQSDYFDTAVTFSEQLFFQSSCFFLLFLEQSLFRSSYSFRIASFSERQFYRAVTSWE